MIEAIWDPEGLSLSINGHSENSEVCAGVSTLAGALFVLDFADEIGRGELFCAFSDSVKSRAVANFVCSALDLLQSKHPAHLRYEVL